MPIYEYGCEAGHRFEVKQKFSDAPITACPVCALPVTKLISASAISFKGAGWYVTDYSDKMKPPATQEKAGSPTETTKDSPETKKESTAAGETKASPSTPSSSPPSSSPSSSESSTPGSSSSSSPSSSGS
jgi:putative FmdB family regulatory protein